jgi:hypothetical protein
VQEVESSNLSAPTIFLRFSNKSVVYRTVYVSEI